MLTESPRVIFCGESPLTNCKWCMGRRKIVRGVGLRRLSGAFLFSGESPPTDCCHPERPQGVEGSSHRFGCEGFVSAKILRRASLAQDDTARLKQKGTSPQRRPNIIIIPHCQTTVNYLHRKSYGFSVLHQNFGSYLCCFPSCKNPCGVVD